MAEQLELPFNVRIEAETQRMPDGEIRIRPRRVIVEEEEWGSTAQAAEILRCSDRAVRLLAARGEVPSCVPLSRNLKIDLAWCRRRMARRKAEGAAVGGL